MEENIIVYLGTGCGKTHIVVLLMYELRHVIREPSQKICVFLAPTVPLVRQQAMVIENFTDFKVRCYFGQRKQLKNHDQWIKTMEQSEVFVMTPEILLQNLRHCYMKMELIALLIFDECHHAQLQTRHPYAQIMKGFYKSNATQRPRIFGMTASPSIGKGGPDQLNFAKCINSLENLLDAKVCTLEDDAELECVVASPEIKVYLYGPVIYTASSSIPVYCQKLERIKQQCTSSLVEKVSDLEERQLDVLVLLSVELLCCGPARLGIAHPSLFIMARVFPLCAPLGVVPWLGDSSCGSGRSLLPLLVGSVSMKYCVGGGLEFAECLLNWAQLCWRPRRARLCSNVPDTLGNLRRSGELRGEEKLGLSNVLCCSGIRS